MLTAQVAQAKRDLEEAKLSVKQAKPEDRKTAEAYVERVTENIKRLEDLAKKKDYTAQEEAWKSQQAYALDAYRMLTNRQLCLNCHQVGNLEASNPEFQRGPPLALAADRLRPDWTLRWIAMPQRFLPYQSVMPTYFLKNEPKYQDLFVGSSLEQATAVRDILMNFRKVAELPTSPAAPGGGK
jgi:hypothetical protein